MHPESYTVRESLHRSGQRLDTVVYAVRTDEWKGRDEAWQPRAGPPPEDGSPAPNSQWCMCIEAPPPNRTLGIVTTATAADATQMRAIASSPRS